MTSFLYRLPSGWLCRGILPTFLLSLNVAPAGAEPPDVRLRPFAPGGIAVDWTHPGDDLVSIIVEREDPAFTWVFVVPVGSFNDLGLQSARIYRYRVCAVSAETPDCSPWHAAQTLEAPPPFQPPAVPRFTNAYATPNSITVNWTSSASYSFHQIRWAEDGHADGQNRITGRSFTASGLRPGSYHFIVQGCNRTLLGSSCSRFSAPMGVRTTSPVPRVPEVATSVIYGIASNGDLLWYRHDGRSDGTVRWGPPGAGMRVGNGWSGFSTVFSGGNGVIYAIERESRDPRTGQRTGGHLLWYRHDGWKAGGSAWTGPTTVGNGWIGFSQVFSGGDGVIYGITSSGDLLWYRHDGRSDGTFRWAPGSGKKVGNGWSGFSTVFSGGNGVIYAIERESRDPRTGQRTGGHLLWYRHNGWQDGGLAWTGPTTVGNGWGNFSRVFSGGDGVIYGITSGGDLLWYFHDGLRDGAFRWTSGTGKKVGNGWGGFSVVLATPSCGFGMEGTPC